MEVGWDSTPERVSGRTEVHTLEGPPQGMGTGGMRGTFGGWGIGGVFAQLYIHFFIF